MTAAYREVTNLVLKALEDFGPMTAKELSAETNVPINNVSMVLTRCRKNNTRKRSKQAKRVHIHTWVHEPIISGVKVRENPRMVFALGNKPDAKKPPPKSDAQRSHKRRVSQLGRANSIFSIGARDMNVLTHDAT
jgi:hypothetical protein